MNDIRIPAIDADAGARSGLFSADAAPDFEYGEGHMRDLLWALWRAKWLVLSIILSALGIGLFKYLSNPPVYVAKGLMQIETRDAGVSTLQQFEQYGDVLGGSISVAAQVAIMRSRTVMADVVRRLHLDIVASPIYAPRIGRAVSRLYRGDGVAKPWFGQTHYAWGGERIEVQSLVVPEALAGTAFILEAGSGGRFRLLLPDGAEMLRGETGVRAEALIAGESLLVFVTRLKARAGTRFRLTKLGLESAAARVAGKFNAVERPEWSGILVTSYSSTDPERAATVLNAIMENYQRRNLERKGEEAEKTLLFLEKQLPPLQARLEAAETAYNDFLRENGTLDIARETQDVLSAITEVESELFILQQERETLRARFKPAHPKIRSIDTLAQKLEAKLSALEIETQALPAVQQTVLRLKRDVEVNSGLYSKLINALQELRIAKAGTVGNARIIDSALQPGRPVSPLLKPTLLISAFLGLSAALALVYLSRKFRRGIEDPDALERRVGLPILATIPFSQFQNRIAKNLKRRKSTISIQPLALQSPEDAAIESIRSLRTSLHFLMLEAENKLILITGPTQGIGKSFVSVNLAILLAQSGKRVLLVDADMRRGHLHRLLGLRLQPGLCEYLTGEHVADVPLVSMESPGFEFLSCGTRPPNPSELLSHSRFRALVEARQPDYDYILVDAPPVLAVTDAAIVGQLAGATLLVARSQRNTEDQVEESVRVLKHGGARIKGVLLNGFTAASRYGYRYGYRDAYRYAEARKANP